jgi:ketosteroid isomerase-like protein
MSDGDVVLQSIRAWNAGDQDAYVACFAEDCELVTPTSIGKGHEGVIAFWRENMEAFPGCQVASPRHLLSVGGVVMVETAIDGVNTGALRTPDGQEIPPTGRSISVPMAGVHEVREGRIASVRFYWDVFGGLLVALGLA